MKKGFGILMTNTVRFTAQAETTQSEGFYNGRLFASEAEAAELAETLRNSEQYKESFCHVKPGGCDDWTIMVVPAERVPGKRKLQKA